MRGRMINNQLIISRGWQNGDKPIVYTNMPTMEYVCTYAFEERDNGIYQVWTVTDMPIEPIPIDGEEATAEDYENALGRFGV